MVHRRDEMKRHLFLLTLLGILIICQGLSAQTAFQGPGITVYKDSIGIDTNGDGSIDSYIGPIAVFKKGDNITMSVDGDIVTIAGAAGGISASVVSDTATIVRNEIRDTADAIGYLMGSAFPDSLGEYDDDWNTVLGWGDHSAQNYLDNDDAHVDTAQWNEGYDSVVAWGDIPATYMAGAAFDDSLNNHVEIGNYIDTTTLDTITVAHKAVEADSATKALQDAAGNVITSTYLTAVDSTNITDGDLSLDDLNWHYEWIYLDLLHGWGRAISDTIYLTFPMHDGSSSYLLLEHCGNITAGDKDTFFVSGAVPYTCTIDSIELAVKTKATGSSYLDSITLYGPDLTDAVNMTDSVYWGDATNLTGTSGWDIKGYAFGEAISASAGDRFALKVESYFAEDDDSIHVGYIKLRVKR